MTRKMTKSGAPRTTYAGLAVAGLGDGQRRRLIAALRKACQLVGLGRRRGVGRLGGATSGTLLAGLSGRAACLAGVSALTLTAVGIGGLALTVAPTPAAAVECAPASTATAGIPPNDNGNASNTACGSNATAIDQGGGNATAYGNTATALNDGATALGAFARASGLRSLALGYASNAAAEDAIATGYGSTAQGEFSTAVGNAAAAGGTSSNGFTNASTTAIGRNATAGTTGANEVGATALGDSAGANVANGTALGQGAVANNAGDVALGQGSVTAAANSTLGNSANGVGTNAGAASSVVSVGGVNALGATITRQIQNVAAGSISATSTDAVNGSQLYGVATQVQAITGGTAGPFVSDNEGQGAPTAPGYNASAGGFGAHGYAAYGTAVGNNSQAGYNNGDGFPSFNDSAFGYGAQAGVLGAAGASGGSSNATAVGTNANAAGENSTAVGASTQANGNGAVSVGSGGNQFLLLAVKGDVPIPQTVYGATADNATAVGYQSIANATNATALGQGASASNTGAIAIGSGSGPVNIIPSNNELRALATIPDNNPMALGPNSIAIGTGSVANDVSGAPNGGTTIAIGPGATAGIAGTTTEGGDILAIGTLSTATGTNATAVGGSASATGDYGTAIGNGATANVANATALGQGAVATYAGDVALGQGSVTDIAHPTPNATADGVFLGPFAGANPSSVVSVGAPGAERQITNVAAGQISQNSTDAVNGSQLYALAVALGERPGGGGNAPFVSEQQNPGQAFPAAAGTNSSAGGYGATGLGPQSTAVGNNSNAAAANSTAVGYGAQALGTGSIAEGSGAISNGTGSIAIGQGAQAANGGTAIGAGAVANGDPTIAGGMNAMASGNNSTAYGANATATLDNSVALGQASTTTAASSTAGNAALGVADNAGAVTAGTGNVVSVGGNGVTRQIQNVAAGALTAGSTDAVNGSQLYSVATNVNNLGAGTAAAIGGGAAYSPTTGFTGPSYALNGSTATYTNVVAGEQALANGAAGPVQYSTPGTPSNAVNLVGTGGAVTLGNVAPGAVTATSTQAINGSQLYGNAASVASALGGGAAVTAAGAVSAPRYDIGGTNYNNVGSALAALQGNMQNGLTNLQNELSQSNQRLSGGIASAIAGSGLRYDDRAGKFSTAAAVAGYHDQFGFAGGFGYTSLDARWRVNAAFTLAPVNGHTDVGGVGGLSYTWN